MKVESVMGPQEFDGTLKNSYIGIPLEINYQVFKSIPFRIGFGAYLNLLLKSEEKGTMYLDTSGFIYYQHDPALDSIATVQEYNIDQTNHYNPFDFGLVTKVEYEFKLKNKISLVAFSKFNYGLTATRDKSNSFTYYKWKNYTLIFGLGIKI